MYKNIKLLHKNLCAGQSLIEVVVGLSIATLLAVALISATLYTQKLTTSAKNNTQATKLAQEAIEQIRVIRDRQGFGVIEGRNDANTEGSSIDTVSNPDPSSWILSAAGPCPAEQIQFSSNEPNFGRCITIQPGNNSNQKKITVTVSWEEPSGPGDPGIKKIVNTTFLAKPCDGPISGC